MLLCFQTHVANGQYKVVNLLAGWFPVVFHLKYVYYCTERAMQSIGCFSPALAGHIYN